MKALWLVLTALPAFAGPVPVRLEIPAAAARASVVTAAALSTRFAAASVPLTPPAPSSALAAPKTALQLPVTAPLPADAPGLHRVVAVGDAGTADKHQQAIADAMTAERDRKAFATVLALGDNVYKNGEVEKFDRAIRDPYAALFDGGVRFFPVLGNHDVRTQEGERQLEYWGAPRWYSKVIGETEFFAIDTTILIPTHQSGAYDADPERIDRLAREQLAWLESALAASGARHKVVFGHHPVYVSTDEPDKVVESAELRGRLEALLKKHGVKLYLAGHKHDYERSRPVGGVTHVISGAGGQLSDKPATHPSGVSEKIVQKRHFLVIDQKRDGLHIRALNKDGEVIDEFVLP